MLCFPRNYEAFLGISQFTLRLLRLVIFLLSINYNTPDKLKSASYNKNIDEIDFDLFDVEYPAISLF